MNEKDPQGEVASSQRPRSPRVPVEFALEVEGTDASGNPFQAKAMATKISRGGATIAIDVDVAVGSVVKLVPPFGASLSQDLATNVIQLSQDMLVVALKLAAPVFCTILIVNASMAMLGRAVAQMNVFVLSFPITIGAGLFVMGLALPYSLHLFESEFLKLMDVMFGLLQRLGHG